MSHMQKQITEKMRGWMVETRDAGTCCVPDHVVSVPHYLATGAHLEASDNEIFTDLCARLADYIEGRHILHIEVCEGYFARMSAPGYLDCTEWTCYMTLKDARAALREYDE